jgi:hypothetical protein
VKSEAPRPLRGRALGVFARSKSARADFDLAH